MDMDDTNDGEAVPMTKEAVVHALKGDLLSLDGDGVVVNTKSEAYGKWLLLSANNMESIMAKGVQSVAGVIGTEDHSTVRDAVKGFGTRVPDHGKVLWDTGLRIFRISKRNHAEIAYGENSVYVAFSVERPAKPVAEEYGIGAKQQQQHQQQQQQQQRRGALDEEEETRRRRRGEDEERRRRRRRRRGEEAEEEETRRRRGEEEEETRRGGGGNKSR